MTIFDGADELEPLDDHPLDPPELPPPPPKKNADASRDSNSTHKAITTNTYLVHIIIRRKIKELFGCLQTTIEMLLFSLLKHTFKHHSFFSLFSNFQLILFLYPFFCIIITNKTKCFSLFFFSIKFFNFKNFALEKFTNIFPIFLALLLFYLHFVYWKIYFFFGITNFLILGCLDIKRLITIWC